MLEKVRNQVCKPSQARPLKVLCLDLRSNTNQFVFKLIYPGILPHSRHYLPVRAACCAQSPPLAARAPCACSALLHPVHTHIFQIKHLVQMRASSRSKRFITFIDAPVRAASWPQSPPPPEHAPCACSALGSPNNQKIAFVC